MKIASWNVNGLRAVVEKGFINRVMQENPDILCLQEVKCFSHQIPSDVLFVLKDYEYVRHTGTKPGYAGTAIFWKKSIPIIEKKNTFGQNHVFNDDGRVTQVMWVQASKRQQKENVKNSFSDTTCNEGEKNEGEKVVLLNIYFPNGGTRADGTEMLSYKLAFYDEVISYCDNLVKQGYNTIITGDFNICHTEIDIARPEENENSIGFLPIERAKITEFLSHGYIDVFRYFYPNEKGQYTRWSYRAGARARNIGRRLDYFVVNKSFIGHVKKITHQTKVMGSDHCPIVLEM